MNAHQLLDDLLAADSEEDVTAALQRQGVAEYDDSNWKPYGGRRNNAGIVHNQQSDAHGPLAEKIINAVDAMLTRACKERGIDPEGPDAPKTMNDAAEKFFGVPGGNLARLSPTARSALAENIRVALCGKKPNDGYPCILMVDKGEGQHPWDFEDTFLSLQAENKVKVPFVQGKYNQGATGALRYCGNNHNYQLIVSRRCPNLDSEGPWGFTVVRRRPPMDGYRNSIYEYLTIQGKIPSVEASDLPLWPQSSHNPFLPLQWGTFIKLYEYRIPKTQATLDFYYALSRRLYRLALPVRIVEMRDYPRSHTPEATLSGLRVRLEEDRGNLLEDGFPAWINLDIAGIGRLPVLLAAFKTGASTKTKRYFKATEAVAFTVNGQTHAFLSSDFLRANKVGLKWLADSLLVEVDCSDMQPAIIDKLFMGSRDRMSECEYKTQLEKDLANCIKHHHGLRELNEKRHQEAMENAAKSIEAKKTLEKLLRDEPNLGRLLKSGREIVDPTRSGQAEKGFEGKRYPTYLELKRKYPEGKACPINGMCRVELETDAENSYLDRAHDPGELHIDAPKMRVDYHLFDGTLTLTIKPTTEAQVGEQQKVCVRLSTCAPEVPSGWLQEEVEVRFVPEGTKKQSGTHGTSDGRKARGFSIPEVREVYKENWDHFEWNAESTVRIDKGNQNVVSFVNYDNKHLHTFRYHNPKQSKLAWIQFSTALTVVGLYCETLCEKGELSEQEREKVLRVVAALILHLLPLGKVEE